MRQGAATVGMAAIVAAACTYPPAGTPQDGRPAVVQVDLTHLAEEAAHSAPTDAIDDTGDDDPSDSLAVSTHTIGAALQASGLAVTDIGAHLEADADSLATVRVFVTHRVDGLGVVAEQTSIYLLDLIRGPDGRWTVTDRRLVR